MYKWSLCLLLLLSCVLISAQTCETVSSTDFENNLGIWQCTNEVSNLFCQRSGQQSNSGVWSVELNLDGEITSDPFSMFGYDSLVIQFFFYASGLEEFDQFIVEYSDDGGENFVNLNTFQSFGVGIPLNAWLGTEITFTNMSNTTDFVFRLRNNSPSINKTIYVDDITVRRCNNQQCDGSTFTITSIAQDFDGSYAMEVFSQAGGRIINGSNVLLTSGTAFEFREDFTIDLGCDVTFAIQACQD